MKVLGSSIIAALARGLGERRTTVVNAGVGFGTFALGDCISQVHSRQLLLPQQRHAAAITDRQRRQKDHAEPSWQQRLLGELQERTSGVDLARSAKVGLLGVLLNGFALGAWYRVLDRYIGSDRTRIQQVLKKCVVDQFVYAPFSITSFVGYAAVLNGGGPAVIVANTKASLVDHGLETWIMDWKVWPAANIIMFRFIPSSYRPSFASLVQVAWQAYLSSVSYDNPHGSPSSHQPRKAAIRAGDSGGVRVRGGGVTGTEVAEVAATARAEGEGRGVPLLGLLPTGSVPANSGAVFPQRKVVVDRRATGRYAYTSPGPAAPGTPPVTVVTCDNATTKREAGRVLGGGGGGDGGVRVVAVQPSPSSSSPSSSLLPKTKEL